MENEQLNRVYEILYNWTLSLCSYAGRSQETADELWNNIKKYPEILKEYAYYHDKGEALCDYSVQGYTLADIMIWQIDHFRAHMDRLDNDNKVNAASLLIDSFECMITLREDPDKIIGQFADETGTDLASGWTIG